MVALVVLWFGLWASTAKGTVSIPGRGTKTPHAARCSQKNLAFLGGLVIKNLPANAGDAGDMGLISGSGRSPGQGNGNLIQYSCLKNLMDRETQQAIVNEVAKRQTWLSEHTRILTYIKTVIITVFLMFKKTEEKLSLFIWDMKDKEKT